MNTNKPLNVLCVCIGNGDRSPAMMGVLSMFLRNAGHTDVVVSSAGYSDEVQVGKPPARFAIEFCKTLGIDISWHKRRSTVGLAGLTGYDLYVVVDDAAAGALVKQGVDLNKIFNADVKNPWPPRHPEQYTATFDRILAAMAQVVRLEFPVLQDKTQGG